jgi:hypothetical protein
MKHGEHDRLLGSAAVMSPSPGDRSLADQALSIELPALRWLRHYLVLIGLWRPNNQPAWLLWQCVVFCCVAAYFVTVLLALFTPALVKAFSSTPVKLGTSVTDAIVGLSLNLIPVIAFVSAFRMLNRHLTLWQVLRGERVSGFEPTRCHINHCVTLLGGIMHLRDPEGKHRVRTLSGRARERVSVARALLKHNAERHAGQRYSEREVGAPDGSPLAQWESSVTFVDFETVAAALTRSSGRADTGDAGAQTHEAPPPRGVAIDDLALVSENDVVHEFGRRARRRVFICAIAHFSLTIATTVPQSHAAQSAWYADVLYIVVCYLWWSPAYAMVLLFSICACVHELQLDDLKLGLMLQAEPDPEVLTQLRYSACGLHEELHRTSSAFQFYLLAVTPFPAFAVATVAVAAISDHDSSRPISSFSSCWMGAAAISHILLLFVALVHAARLTRLCDALRLAVSSQHLRLASVNDPRHRDIELTHSVLSNRDFGFPLVWGGCNAKLQHACYFLYAAGVVALFIAEHSLN